MARCPFISSDDNEGRCDMKCKFYDHTVEGFCMLYEMCINVGKAVSKLDDVKSSISDIYVQM